MNLRASALIAVAALVLAGCSDPDAEGGEGRLTVYVSLPLSGPRASDGRDAADGAMLALAVVGAEAGGYTIEAKPLDAGAPRRGWSPALAAANARTATQDSTTIAYIGDFESGATRASLPITNDARMLQVSPASGAADLVAPTTVSDDVPEAVQTTGIRTFGRVIPSDAAQAEAAAAWAAELGAGSVGALDSGTTFGELLSGGFEAGAEALGLTVRGPNQAQLRYLAGEPDYFLGLDIDPVLIHGRPQRQIASDAFLAPGVAARLARYQGPFLVTSAALDPRQLPVAGREFVGRFEARFGRPPGRFAAYGYEAMAVILDSVGRAADAADREAVVDAFFETEDRDSVLGTYSITELGETSLGTIGGYRIENGRLSPERTLSVP